jgi:hypothetical protein
VDQVNAVFGNDGSGLLQQGSVVGVQGIIALKGHDPDIQAGSA